MPYSFDFAEINYKLLENFSGYTSVIAEIQMFKNKQTCQKSNFKISTKELWLTDISLKKLTIHITSQF